MLKKHSRLTDKIEKRKEKLSKIADLTPAADLIKYSVFSIFAV